jgi:hypothetical protein
MQPSHRRLEVVESSLNPNCRSAAIWYVRNEEWQPSSPEEPDRSGGELRIVITSLQYEWLTKQCHYLGITKQQLVSNAFEEWICRNRTVVLPRDPSAMVRKALEEFIRRHQDEFLPATDPS